MSLTSTCVSNRTARLQMRPARSSSGSRKPAPPRTKPLISVSSFESELRSREVVEDLGQIIFVLVAHAVAADQKSGDAAILHAQVFPDKPRFAARIVRLSSR